MNEYSEDGYRKSIREWSAEERPREKLITLGSGGVSTAELLAIILGNGTRDASAVDLARRVLNRFDESLHKLEGATAPELMTVKGIGMASATRILAVFMLANRQRSEQYIAKKKITGSQAAYELMRPYLTRLPFEEFWIALLNRSNKVVKTIQLSKGGISGTVVDIKKLYGYVLEYRAAGIILYHNHPSGSELPSEADKTLTQKICRMASVMDVLILDHIIVGDEKYFSFADHGML